MRNIWALVIIVILAHSALYLHIYKNFPDIGKSFDTQYTNISENLYRYGAYSTGERDASGNLLPTLSEPPLYVALYFVSYKIFGITPAADEAMRILQTIANIGVIFVCWRIGALFGDSVGRTAVLFAAFDLTAFYFAQNYQIPDTLLGFFMALWLLYSIKFFKDTPSFKNIFLSTLFLGLAMWTKIAVYLLWAPLTLFLIIFLWYDKRLDRHAKMRVFAVFAAVILFFFGGWKVHNYVTTGYSAFSSGATSLRWNASHLIAYQQGISRVEAVKVIENEYITKEVLHMDEGAREQHLASKMSRLILQSPVDFSAVVLKAMPGMFLGTFPPYMLLHDSNVEQLMSQVEATHGFRSLIPSLWKEGQIMYVFIYGLAKFHLLLMYGMALVAGALFLRNSSLRWILIVMFLTVAYTIAVSGAAAQSRYRTIVFPIFYVLAGYGMIIILEKIKKIYANTRQHPL